MLLFACYGHSQVNVSSGYQRSIVIDHTKVANTDQTDFPVLISGTYPFLATTANGGQVLNANGYDIIFTSDAAGQNLLDFEIDSYNPTTGAASFWVRIPTLSHVSDTTVYMFYGIAGITTSQENKAGVWRNNYLSVYHLGDGNSVGLSDSASAGYQLSGSGSPTAVAGPIGGGVALTGDSGTYLFHDAVPAYPSGSSPVTLESWVKIESNPGGVDIFGYGENSWDGSRVSLGTASNSAVFLEFENMGFSGPLSQDSAWHHLVGVYGGGTLGAPSDQLYFDGSLLSTATAAGTPLITTTELKIGGIPAVTSCCGFNGSVDEVRVSSGVRSPDWVATEFANQSSTATFYSIGFPVEVSSLGSFSSTVANPGFSNTATMYSPDLSMVNSGSTATYNLSAGTIWHSPINSSSYVSYDPGTGPTGSVIAPNGDYYYTTTFTVGPNVSMSSAVGSLTILADDTVGVYLNGVQILAAAGPMGSDNTYHRCSDVVPNCIVPDTFNFSGIVNGTNVLTFDVKQVNGGNEGLDYWGTITVNVGAVTVAPSSAQLYGGQTQQFSASVANTNNQAVTWTISPAGTGTISSSGLYTAPATIASQQSVTVTATNQADTTKSASATVTLEPPVTVGVSPGTATLSGGQTQQFTATVANSSNTVVTWTLSPTGAGSISATGLYTASATIASQQTVTVTATSQANTSVSASSTVTLSPPQCTLNPYGYVRALVIDHSKVPNTDQTDFPMLVMGTYPFLATVANGGRVQSANGYDIVFTSDPQGQTPLDFEIDNYNPQTGAAGFWVRIPTLSHTTDTPIYMWYGNPNITSSQENKTGVWRNNYLSVYHFGSGSAVGLTDSGSAAYDLADSPLAFSRVTLPVAGVVGGGAWLTGYSSLVHHTVSAYPSGDSPVTIEAWAQVVPSVFGAATIVGYGSNSSQLDVGSNSLPSAGGWHHIVGVYGGPSLASALDYVYVDGVLVSTTDAVNDLAAPLATDELRIGARPAASSCCGFDGYVDEVRISSGNRSADWVATEYNNQSSPLSFYRLQVENTIPVTPIEGGLYASETLQFNATALGNCADTLTWSINPAGLGTITSTGLYTAPTSISLQQPVAIIATDQTGSLNRGIATVMLYPAPRELSLSLTAATQPPYMTGTSHQFQASLKNPDGTPLSGATVSFNVTGTNAGSGNSATDWAGVATFSYTGTSSGNDTIQASTNISGVNVTSNIVSAPWLVPVQQISTSAITGEFFTIGPDVNGTFDILPTTTPLFTQTFPTVNFNPPSGTIPGAPSGLDITTRPFTDVTTDLNGNFTGTVIAQGNGYQAGVGPMQSFQAVFKGEFTVTSAGNVAFNFYSDDGFILGIANGATRVSGASTNMPAATPFANYPTMGAINGPNPASGNQVVVYFPASGTYPFELDYTECCGGGLSLTMTQGASSATGIAPMGAITISPGSLQPLQVGGQQSFTVLATDATGAPVDDLHIAMVVNGTNNLQGSATTDSTGHATFVYTDVEPGTDSVQAVAFISGMVEYSNVVSVPWTLPAGTTGVNSGNSSTLDVSISAENTVILPNPLQLNGAATDSALASGDTIATAWTKVSGPGAVTFGNPQQAVTTASFGMPGAYVLQLSASDLDASGAVQLPVTVNPVPGVPQGWIGSPVDGATVDGIVPITVASGVTLVSGTLTYYPAGNPGNAVVLNGNTTGSGQIATLDTTNLADGSYWITLQATDSSGDSQFSLSLVTVVGDYKPGRITTSVTDLVIPANGLAIKIQRNYDSLKAGTSSDFGYGWSLGTSVDLKVDDRGNVTFTLNGVRRTFYLNPQYGGWLIPYYLAAFTPEPGLHGTLTDNGSGCDNFVAFLVPDSSSWVCAFGGGFYNPTGYVYTDPSGTSYAISANGNLQSILDKNGNGLTIGSTGISSSGSTSLSVPFVRDSNGRITTITDPSGNVYHYYYNEDYASSGNLTSISYPGVTQRSTYTYTPSGHLYTGGTVRGNPLPITTYYTTETDPNGYPLSGRVKSETDALGQTWSYSYDLVHRVTTVTYPPDPSGTVGSEVRGYDSYGMMIRYTSPLLASTTNTYDTGHNLISTTDPYNNTTTYGYDVNGNRTSTTYPATTTGQNTTSHVVYNQYSEPTSTTDQLGNGRIYEYDANYNPLRISDGLGIVASFLVNSNGSLQAGAVGYDLTTQPTKASKFTYDSSGNLASSTDALSRTQSFTYDLFGDKLSSTSPLPNASTGGPASTTTYQYDALGHVLETDAPEGVSTSSQYDAFGNKISYTDARGNTTYYQYDALNRLTLATYPTQPATAKSWTYDFRNNVVDETDQAGNVTHHTYDLAGRLLSVTQAYGTSNANTTSYAYDADGRKQSETDPRGNTTTYTYDQASRLITVTTQAGTTTQYAYDDAGNRTSIVDPNGNTTQFQYDARKRLVKTIYPDQTTTINSYDGADNLISVTDQAGRSVQYNYDAANQLQSVVQENHPDSAHNTTAYAYDNLGNLTGVTDENGHTTTSSFDVLSRLTATTLPDGSLTESRQYDAAGNLHSLTHFNGKATTYTYDNLNRLASRTPDASLSEPTVSFTYTGTGKRASMADASGTTTYTYDNLDRLIAKATPEGTLNYTYDAFGKVASMASSNVNGASVSYTYDTLNRLSTVVDNRLPSGQNTTTYTYDASSNIVTATYPNGLQSVLAYDSLNRLSSLSTPVSSYTYQLGPTGNRTSATELSGRALTWNYDAIYRLTGETVNADPTQENGNVGYSLDPVGNRLSETSSLGGVSSNSFDYNADDELASDSYDLNGNTTTVVGGKTFAYDSENRLTAMNGGQVTLVYDGDGNRVSKTVGGSTTQYLIDTLNPTGYAQVVDELVNGALQREYVYGRQRISENQIINGAWTPSFYEYDGGGSVRQLVSAVGVVTDTYEYDAFGNKIHATGTTQNNYLYRGEQYDPDLGLYYLRARYYNPVTGRFLSRDLASGNISDPVTLHRYLYANGNPVDFADPSGRESAFANPCAGGAINEYRCLVAAAATLSIAFVVHTTPIARNIEFPGQLGPLWLSTGSKSDPGQGNGPVAGPGNPPAPPLPPGCTSMETCDPGSGSGNLSDAQKIARPIIDKYKNLDCADCAKELEAALNDSGYKGNIVKVTTNGSRWMMSDYAPSSDSITLNGTHYGVVVNIEGAPYAFDNFANGVPYDQWLSGFHADGGIAPPEFPPLK